MRIYIYQLIAIWIFIAVYYLLKVSAFNQTLWINGVGFSLGLILGDLLEITFTRRKR